jgi:hypothetical protein
MYELNIGELVSIVTAYPKVEDICQIHYGECPCSESLKVFLYKQKYLVREVHGT